MTLPALPNTSASQVNAWRRCQRYWYFGWIDRVPCPETDAQRRGKEIHAEIEYYMLTGDVREHPKNYHRYVEAAIPHLPAPKGKAFIEHKFWQQTEDGLPPWLGYIDLLYDTDDETDLVVVDDTKTTSNLRYAKTPEELRTNPQLISYAKYVYEMGHEGPVQVGHIYIRTTPKRVPKKPKTKVVRALVDRDHVEAEWSKCIDFVREMVYAAQQVSAARDLPPTTTACSMYGGCPFRKQCGLQIGDLIQWGVPKKGKAVSSFLEKLKQKKAAAEGDSAEVPTGVVPPDAPPRESSEAEAAEVQAKAAEKAAKRKKKKAKATEATVEATEVEPKPKPKTKTKKKSKKKANGSPGFTLYVDCAPTKGAGELEPTLFEDWFAPIVVSMNEACQTDKDVIDYRLLPYSEEKAMIAIGINEQIKRGLPSEMILTTGTPGAKDALGQLIPHAARVVRSMR